jgi:hypothetical protein
MPATTVSVFCIGLLWHVCSTQQQVIHTRGLPTTPHFPYLYDTV